MTEQPPETRARGVWRFRTAAARRALRKRWQEWRSWARTAGRLTPYVAGQKRRLLLALACGLGFTTVGIAEPWVLKLVLDNVLLGQPLSPALASLLPESKLGILNVLTIGIVLLALARGAFYYFQKLLAARAGQEVTAAVRLDLYRHLQDLSFAFHDRRRTGDLLARLTSDVRLLREIFISLPLSLTSDLVLIAGMVVVMFVMDWSLTLLALLALPLIALALRAYQRPMRRAIRQQREREGEISSIAAEVLGAIKVVQGFQRERYEIRRLSAENKRSLRRGMKAARLEAKLRWFAELSVAVVTAMVLALAARRVLSGALSPGDLLVFVAYLRAFNRPLRQVSRMAERAARGTVAAERVLEMMEVEATVCDQPGAVKVPRCRGAIRFEGVSFRHGRSLPALRGVDLQVDAGERVAIVGPTGGGKTTLVSLIPRFYDPTEGRVSIDGRDVREFTLRSLRKHVSLVFQEPVLFATTVAENIGYGRENVAMDEIVDAATKAGIHPIVEELSEGYETVLGERGCTLSGGQRQCIAIARAMIKRAPIVILDEPTTGLDARSAALVRAALDRLMEGRTVLMITHQLDTLEDMDRIVVVENGRIAEEGTRAVLLARGGGLFQTLQRFQTEDAAR